MADMNPEKLARRTFLNRMAMAASAIPLAPQRVAAAQAAEAARPAAPKGESGYTPRLAQYAAALRYDDIPAAVRQRIKDCITDTVGVVLFGGQLPWSQIVIAHARRSGAGGKSAILGTGSAAVHAPSAALAHGAMAHAFEMDNLTDPDSGSHPGATMFPAGLAVAQERGLGGRALVTAMTAGAEVMIRIGRAAKGRSNRAAFMRPARRARSAGR